MNLIHGGNVYEIAAKLGCTPEDVLDYSASINPLGPPPGLLDLLTDTYQRLQHYPDIRNRELVASIAAYHGVTPEQVVVGNGSTELIYWLPKVLGIRKALIVLPTFAEYQRAFELQEVQLAKLVASPENNLQPTVGQLEEVTAKFSPEAILFTHPGSPSGTLLSPEVRTWLVEKSRTVACLVDEAFVDFCEEESLKWFQRQAGLLVMIRSMTKFYGLPGLRLGYLLTSVPVAERLDRFLPPWSVNTYAQMAGPYCFSQVDYREQTLALIEQERERMSEGLRGLAGCRLFPGRANYLLLELAAHLPSAARLKEHLEQRERILVRDCLSFEGLGDHYVRFAVRLPDQNDRLIEAVTRWVKNQS